MDDGEPVAMCSISVLDFFIGNLKPEELRGKRVLEVGSRNENGSVRKLVERFCSPSEYVGVDISEGPGVDLLVNSSNLLERFGPASFDAVISTEMLEHVIDWRSAVENMKGVLRPLGLIFLTTRSLGFPYHPDPYDCWRFGPEEMEDIFSDFVILKNEPDPRSDGVFVKALRTGLPKKDLSKIHAYSMVIGAKTCIVPEPSQLSAVRRMKLGMTPTLLFKPFRKYGKYLG